MMTHSPWPKGKKKIIEIINNQRKTISNDPSVICDGNIKDILNALSNESSSEGWKDSEFDEINNRLNDRFSRPGKAKFTAHDIFEICN